MISGIKKTEINKISYGPCPLDTPSPAGETDVNRAVTLAEVVVGVWLRSSNGQRAMGHRPRMTPGRFS